MRINQIINLLFFCSLLLLVPLFSSPVTVDFLSPFEHQLVSLNIKSPIVQIEANIPSDIEISVYYFNAQTDQLESIYNVTMAEVEVLDIPKRGYYVFDIFAIEIAEITISERGLSGSTLIIIGIMSVVNLINVIYTRYFGSFTYY